MSTATYPLHAVGRTVCRSCDRQLPLSVAYFQPSQISRAAKPGLPVECRDCSRVRRNRNTSTPARVAGSARRRPLVVITESVAPQQIWSTERIAAEYEARFRAALADEYAATAGDLISDRWMLAYSRAIVRTPLPALPQNDAEVLRGKAYAELRAAA